MSSDGEAPQYVFDETLQRFRDTTGKLVSAELAQAAIEAKEEAAVIADIKEDFEAASNMDIKIEN